MFLSDVWVFLLGRHLLYIFTFLKSSLRRKKYKLGGSNPLDCFLLLYLQFSMSRCLSQKRTQQCKQPSNSFYRNKLFDVSLSFQLHHQIDTFESFENKFGIYGLQYLQPSNNNEPEASMEFNINEMEILGSDFESLFIITTWKYLGLFDIQDWTILCLSQSLLSLTQFDWLDLKVVHSNPI